MNHVTREKGGGEKKKREKNNVIGERGPSSSTAKIFNFYKETRIRVQLISSTIFWTREAGGGYIMCMFQWLSHFSIYIIIIIGIIKD